MTDVREPQVRQDGAAATGGATIPKSVKLEVVATKTATGIEWEIDGKKPKLAQLDLPKDSGSYEIKFDLDDNTGDELRFDCSYPIWVAENTNGRCPGPGIGTDQIEVLDCETDSLIVFDKNDNKGERILHYQLNFKNAAGDRLQVDPEIKNGGG
jgi:hypothetical protein